MASLIQKGSTWKYLDDGSNQGTAWRNLDFNDNNWKTGEAQLGYGDGDEKTTLGFGSNSRNKNITSYFRKNFQVEDPKSVQGLGLSLLRDDGAVVYLNGTEVFRSNMPSGDINYSTAASSAISGADEDTFIKSVIDSGLLHQGDNVLAVEIHQSKASSSDISFDLGLESSSDSNPDGGGNPNGPAQYEIKHNPYLQLGDAPLNGFSGSETDQVEVLWQTIPKNSKVKDSFLVEYRPDNPSAKWLKAPEVQKINTGTGNRVNHFTEIDGLKFDSDYEYRVKHLNQEGEVVETFQNKFRTRLPVGDKSSFSFAAYGDSAYTKNINGFRGVQDRINQVDPDFSILLGDNVYNGGSHLESDARLDPDLNPEAAKWMGSHIDYLSYGNHDIRTDGGGPSEDNYSNPIPVAGVTSTAQLPSSERPEHNYSFDYGDVHFATFDSNSLKDSSRLDGQLDWLEKDLAASDAKWKIVFAHHPVAGVPDKPENPGDNYYQQVVPRLKAAGVDLYLTGHSHTYAWSLPLTGQKNGKATYVNDRDKDYAKGAGLVQVVSGMGGKSLRGGSFSKFPFMAAGYTQDTDPASEFGFSEIKVTPDKLTVDYIAADDGSVIDSFSITDDNASNSDTKAPTLALTSPVDNGPNDSNPANNALKLDRTPGEFQFQLQDTGDGIDDKSVTSEAFTITKGGKSLSPQDYSFSYDAVKDLVTLKSTGNGFADGNYEIAINNGTTKIADLAGNQLASTKFTVDVDTATDPVPPTISKISFQQGLNGYTGTLDTYIQESSANRNHSSASSLNVDGRDRGGSVQSLMRFEDIFGDQAGQISSGAKIKSAKLELEVTNRGDSIEFHRMLQDWSDKDTWGSLNNGIQTNDIEAASKADVITGNLDKGLLSVDVTDSLKAWQSNPQSNFGWAILPTDSNGVDFNSAEGKTAPRLQIEFEAKSDPTTLTNPQISGKTIVGTDAADRLIGTAQDDLIQGGDGKDIIDSRNGNDVLTGGSEADTFVYNNLNGGVDTIKDFEIGSDLIDLSNIFKGSIGDDDGDDFDFDDSVKFVRSGSGTKVQVNPFGDDDSGQFKTLAILDNINPGQLGQKQFII